MPDAILSPERIAEIEARAKAWLSRGSRLQLNKDWPVLLASHRALERQLAEAQALNKKLFESCDCIAIVNEREAERAARAQAEAVAAVLREALQELLSLCGLPEPDPRECTRFDLAVAAARQALSTAPERAKLLSDVVEAACEWVAGGTPNSEVKLINAVSALAALDQKGGHNNG